AMNAMANAADLAEFLHIQVHELARILALVPEHRGGRGQASQARQSHAPHVGDDGGEWELIVLCDAGTAPPAHASFLDLAPTMARQSRWGAPRPGAAVGDGVVDIVGTGGPLVHGLPTDTERSRDGADGFPGVHARDSGGSPVG